MTKLLMKYQLKAIKIVGIAFCFILICYVFMRFILFPFFPYEVKRIINKREDPFWTSQEHLKKWGIEIVKLPLEEEQTIHSIIKDYYETKFISDLEEQLRKMLTTENDPIIKEYYETRLSLLPKLKILKIEFSQPRKYRDLVNRIGIITYVSLTDPPNFLGGYPRDIFVLKKVNGRWEIEKRWEVLLRLDIDEEALIKSYFTK